MAFLAFAGSNKVPALFPGAMNVRVQGNSLDQASIIADLSVYAVVASPQEFE